MESSNGKIHPSDILTAIAYHLPKGRKCFEYDSEKFNKFFLVWRRELPELFESVHFRFEDNLPFSEELYQSRVGMIGSEIVYPSTKPNEYYFTSVVDTRYEKFVRQRIPVEKLSEILEVAQAFDKELGMDERLNVNR